MIRSRSKSPVECKLTEIEGKAVGEAINSLLCGEMLVKEALGALPFNQRRYEVGYKMRAEAVATLRRFGIILNAEP